MLEFIRKSGDFVMSKNIKNENEIIENQTDDSVKKTSQIKRMSGETQEISTIGATRFRTDIKRGLTDEQVQTRIEEGLFYLIRLPLAFICFV